MYPTITQQIREIIQDTFAVEIDQKPNKIAAVQSKYKVSKELMEKASKRVKPLAKDYLQNKSKSEEQELKEFAQFEMEKEFKGFMKPHH